MDFTPSLSSAAGEREHMFDKVVTPSDVGKLNRLVIPKQHAEKYFPLNSAAGEKGLLLSFHDRTGKWWRFRYSYWGSSQSYVITKGWSRFVKDKDLHAGDLVSFHRAAGDVSLKTLFIDWRRRPPDHRRHYYPSLHQGLVFPFFRRQDLVAGAAASPVIHCGQVVSGTTTNYHNTGIYYGGDYCICSAIKRPNGRPVDAQGGDQAAGMVVDRCTAAKRVRLFGVNVECPSSDDDQEDCEMSASTSSTPLYPTGTANLPDLHLFNHGISLNSRSDENPNFRVRSNGAIQAATGVLDKGKPPMFLDLRI